MQQNENYFSSFLPLEDTGFGMPLSPQLFRDTFPLPIQSTNIPFPTNASFPLIENAGFGPPVPPQLCHNPFLPSQLTDMSFPTNRSFPLIENTWFGLPVPPQLCHNPFLNQSFPLIENAGFGPPIPPQLCYNPFLPPQLTDMSFPKNPYFPLIENAGFGLPVPPQLCHNPFLNPSFPLIENAGFGLSGPLPMEPELVPDFPDIWLSDDPQFFPLIEEAALGLLHAQAPHLFPDPPQLPTPSTDLYSLPLIADPGIVPQLSLNPPYPAGPSNFKLPKSEPSFPPFLIPHASHNAFSNNVYPTSKPAKGSGPKARSSEQGRKKGRVLRGR